MSDSLGDLLNKKSYGEPPEFQKIREFVEDAIGMKPRVANKADTYYVTVPSAAAAGALRVHIYRLERELGTNKRVVLRIG
jgi:hypothetical protein